MRKPIISVDDATARRFPLIVVVLASSNQYLEFARESVISSADEEAPLYVIEESVADRLLPE
jgi:hypothetical protein